MSKESTFWLSPYVIKFMTYCEKLTHLDELCALSPSCGTPHSVANTDPDKLREGAKRAAQFHAKTFG